LVGTIVTTAPSQIKMGRLDAHWRQPPGGRRSSRP